MMVSSSIVAYNSVPPELVNSPSTYNINLVRIFRYIEQHKCSKVCGFEQSIFLWISMLLSLLDQLRIL